MKSVVIICFIMCLISCEKADDENRPKRSSSVSSNSFLPAPTSTGTQDVIIQMKTDPDVRAYALKVQDVLSQAYLIKDTASRNALINAQLSPYLEKINTKWYVLLKSRADKNEIIQGGIEGAFPRMPIPASTTGPCENTQAQSISECNRTLAVAAGLCAQAGIAGLTSIGSCLFNAGGKAFLCLASADYTYKRCIASIVPDRLRDGYRLFDWVWYRTKGWTYSPGLQLTVP